MLETHVYEYYAFGYNYFILRHDSLGKTIRGDDDALVESIDQFFEYLASLNLQVTYNAALKMKGIRERLGSMSDDVVGEALANEVHEACNEIDVTLDSELKLRKAFVVMPQRHTAHQLLDEPTSMFGGETVPRLPDIALFDFIEACRSIAFGMATAAVFHLMRCVEAMLREYYTSIVKQKRVKPLLWFPMVQHLRKRRDAPPKALLDHLDHIRVNFRNPTQHPDARYELEEAQDLLSLSVDALNRMARDMAGRE